MLQVESLTVRFGGLAALAGLSFAVQDGEIVMISGPSGCGKSTLARSLNGLIPHNSLASMRGRVVVDGLDTREHAVALLARHVAVVPQHAEAQLFGLTVEDEVAFGPRNLGLPPSEVAGRVEAALASLGLAHLRRTAPATLSAGEKQRLAIAAAVAMQPRLLVLDEPTANLDVAGTRALAEVLARLAQERGTAIVILEHKTGELMRLASRLLVLQEGRILAAGEPAAVLGQRPLLRHLGLRRPSREQQTAWADLIAPAASGLGGFDGQRPLPRCPGASPGGDAGLLERQPTLTPSLCSGQALPSPPGGKGLGPEPPFLELRGLEAGYGRHNVLCGVDLAVRRGEMLALVGDNGAGKSTLARAIAGLLPVRRGELRLAGAARRPRPGRDVALLLECPDEQLFCDTVEEEVRLGPENLGRQCPDPVEDALQATGLVPLRRRAPHTLSLGQRQRTVLAALLALRAPLLILDEPTLGQDWGHLSRSMDYVRRLNAQGMTVLIISHDYKLVHQYARRIVLLEEGRVVADGVAVKRQT